MNQGEKIYVQHLLKKNQEEVYEILKNNKGKLYICGQEKYFLFYFNFYDKIKKLNKNGKRCDGNFGGNSDRKRL